MYKTPVSNGVDDKASTQVLMGAAQPAAPSQSAITKTLDAGGSLLATDKPVGGDMRSKMREDPLMLIKQREAQHLKSLSANQVQMHRMREEELEREYREALGGGKESSRDKHKHKRDHKDKKHRDKHSDDEERERRKEKKRKRELEGERGTERRSDVSSSVAPASSTTASKAIDSTIDPPRTTKSPKTLENTHPGGAGTTFVDSDEEKRKMERQRDAMMDEGRHRPQPSHSASIAETKKQDSFESKLHVPSSSSSSDDLLLPSSDTRTESRYREEDRRSYRDDRGRYDARDSRNDSYDSRADSRPDARRSDNRSDRHDYGQRTYDESSRHGATRDGKEHRDYEGRRRDDRDFYDRPSYDSQRRSGGNREGGGNRGGNYGGGRGGRGAFDLSEEERNNAIRQMQQGAQQLSDARTSLINDTRDARVREEEDHRRKATETSRGEMQPSFLSSMHHDALKSSSVEDRVSRSKFYLSKDE